MCESQIFRYANRAKNIKNQPRINEDPKDALLRKFQQELLKSVFVPQNEEYFLNQLYQADGFFRLREALNKKGGGGQTGGSRKSKKTRRKRQIMNANGG